MHVVQAHSLFDQVAGCAHERGMKLNESKTNLLCIVAARTHEPKAYINVEDDIILSRKKNY